MSFQSHSTVIYQEQKSDSQAPSSSLDNKDLLAIVKLHIIAIGLSFMMNLVIWTINPV